jgi:hypothetical protein
MFAPQTAIRLKKQRFSDGLWRQWIEFEAALPLELPAALFHKLAA